MRSEKCPILRNPTGKLSTRILQSIFITLFSCVYHAYDSCSLFMNASSLWPMDALIRVNNYVLQILPIIKLQKEDIAHISSPQLSEFVKISDEFSGFNEISNYSKFTCTRILHDPKGKIKLSYSKYKTYITSVLVII